jgi:leucine-rich PPR motif-containing protein
VNSEKCDDALEVLKEAVKDVCLENMNRTSLLRLQNGLQKEEKTFPYEVPIRVRKWMSYCMK